MIVNLAEFIIDGDKVKLITRCYNCNKDVDVIEALLHNLPESSRFLPSKDKPIIDIQINLRCPDCKFQFRINRLKYLEK